MRLSPGTRLGPYEILSPLGAGGMGEVYRARDARLDREVAVKILPEAMTGDARARSRFEREAKTVAALSHPNILAIHDIDISSETPYAVMELLEGETLADRIALSPLPWKEAVARGAEIAEGLAAAHAKGVVHRDLKPSNIFLTDDGRLKILDFGLARATQADSSAPETRAETVTTTEPGTVLGTVGYMSPEQIRGLPAEATSDIFSYGCVLYEMVAGKRPFGGATVPEAMASILRDPAPSASDSEHPVPAELDRVIAHCLEKEPTRRFQSAQDLLFALRSLQTGPTETLKAQPAPRRTLSRAGLLAAIAVLVLAGAIFLARGRVVPSARWRSVAVLPLANLSGDPEQEYFADGMTDELITDLSKIQSLRVISRTSMMRFKGTKESLPAISKALGVDLVVEGSVRRSGQQVRIAAKLVEGATERSLWAESFERDLKDVFALQSEVATAITREIGGRLSTEDTARLAPKKRVDAEAYEAYLKGNYYRAKFDPASLEKSREYFEKAIRIAPDFALPYLGLAFFHISSAVEGAVAPKLAFPKAEAVTMRAFELEPGLPEVHGQLAWIRAYYHWNLGAAEKEFARADELRGGRLVGFDSGLFARYRGDFGKAIRLSKDLLANDPLALGPHLKLGTAYAWARRYDEAIETYRKAVEIHPDSSEAHELLADAYAMKGSHGEAIGEQKKALGLANLDDWAEELGRDFAALGWEKAQRNLARKRLDEMTALAKEGHYVSALNLAALHAQLGEKDEAFRWLDKALGERSPFLIALNADPQWNSIRSDPRFAALARRVVPSQ